MRMTRTELLALADKHERATTNDGVGIIFSHEEHLAIAEALRSPSDIEIVQAALAREFDHEMVRGEREINVDVRTMMSSVRFREARQRVYRDLRAAGHYTLCGDLTIVRG